MKFRLRCICLPFIFLTAGVAQQRVTWFVDDFQRLEIGASWHRVPDPWKLIGGVLVADPEPPGRMLSSKCYIYGQKPFTIEVTFRGNRAGIYLCLDDTVSHELSELISLDGTSLAAGYINGAGSFILAGTGETGRATADWTSLRVEVDPSGRRYDVTVNERRVLTDVAMRFPSGWIGLEAPGGLTEFKSIRVSGDEYQGKLDGFGKGDRVSFRHTKYLEVRGTRVQLYDPERDRLQEIDNLGDLFRSRRVKKRPEVATTAKTGEHIYAIEGNRLLVKNNSGSVIDTITEGLKRPTALLADSNSVYVADKGAGAIFRFDSGRQLIGKYTASAIGGFTAPHAMAFQATKGDYFRNGEIVVADYDRILFVPRSLDERIPVVHPASPTEVVISWERWPMSHGDTPTTDFAPNPKKPKPLKGRIQYAEEGGEWHEVEAEMNGTWRINHAVLKNLKPGTRYSYRISTPVRMIPQTDELSAEYQFTTNSAD